MSEPIITVENLSKCYVIGHQAANNDGLRHALTNLLHAPKQWLEQRKQRRRATVEEFWALKDVSFSINRGDVVGVIGRNGAGKSTLLKILSRITEPTTGRITLDGRVASLLEVGTGFHAELSGRENIYLNGAILGMGRAEIKRKFDEIVAFSEVEKFLDTPVKRYSSGMYVRLAFAVAAHLEPEILIVDEVLAVGDQAFQKKCLGKMNEVARGGRTVFFVSHNMAVMRQLCNRGILLHHGKVMRTGDINEVMESYLAAGAAYDGSWQRGASVPSRDGMFIEAVRLLNPAGEPTGNLNYTDSFSVEIKIHANSVFTKGQVALVFLNNEGTTVFTTCNSDGAEDYRPIAAGRHKFCVTVPGKFLAPGSYFLRVATHQPHVQAYDMADTLSFRMEDAGSPGFIFNDVRKGLVEPILPWSDTLES
jgi:lipopolysaccharide transport system ATP-binding protein